MITKKRWPDQLMLSLLKKEATYDAGVTMDNTNACSMKGFESEVSWDDEVVNDKDAITGTEHGTDQEIVSQGVKINYKEARCKPNTLIGLAALTLGSHATTQDAALTAYKHNIVPVAVGSALPSIQAEEKAGGIQYAYKGIKGNSLKLSGEAGGFLSLESELIGSGTRDTSATAFANKISESWMKMSNCSTFLESAGDISIASPLTQGAQNISSSAPENIAARMKSFELTFNNNSEKQLGFGGAGVAQDIDYNRRAIELKLSLLFNDVTELNYYLNQDALALELDLKGALIAAGGAMYFGGQIIVPRFKLKAAPLPKGGVDDVLTVEFDCDVQDDGTNDALIIEGYSAQSAYLAA